ncbi:hypothetical protein JOB18_037970 [Solea senegalensis]|uniref:Uncharacterized protein n=1 Tax=Solea senegalensis TaxID=28829 RepID=A0AAV6TA16_SOLSE|nr:hypothetical protein JOB18_037970 [Solea senegalensis]
MTLSPLDRTRQKNVLRHILFSQLESGTRSRFCDQLKSTLLRHNIDRANWETLSEVKTGRMENERHCEVEARSGFSGSDCRVWNTNTR